MWKIIGIIAILLLLSYLFPKFYYSSTSLIPSRMRRYYEGVYNRLSEFKIQTLENYLYRLKNELKRINKNPIHKLDFAMLENCNDNKFIDIYCIICTFIILNQLSTIEPETSLKQKAIKEYKVKLREIYKVKDKVHPELINLMCDSIDEHELVTKGDTNG